MIKAVIFDMDGLLIDSEDLWIEADLKIFNRVGVPLTLEMVKETIGLREDEIVEYWFSRYPWQGISKEKVLADILEEATNLIKERSVIMEGAKEIIELFSAQNIPMAVASSSEDIIIDTALTKVGIKDKFQVIYSAEHETRGKPDPGVYLTTAKKLGVSPNECLAFEDSSNGILSAKAAGMKCAVVLNKYLKDHPTFVKADLVLGSLKEFTLTHLENLNK